MPPVISLRLNPRKSGTTFDKNAVVPWCDNGRYLNERPNFTADPLLHAGAYYVQEASSMLLDTALRQCADWCVSHRILDLCAAPGGKSTLVASIMSADSFLLSNEVIQSRASILAENLSKWGQMNTWVSNSDPKQLGKLQAFFDVLIIDAPCSGSGLFRKIPSYLEDWNPDFVNLCAERQKRIFQDSYSALSQHGLLVYMTCSFSRTENEEMLDYLMDEFEMDSVALDIPVSWGITATLSDRHGAHGYRCYPHKLKGEGFFLACFRKKDGSPLQEFKPVKSEIKYQEALNPYLSIGTYAVYEHDGHLFLMHPEHLTLLKPILSHSRLIKKGILAGKMIRQDFIPDHELALYHGLKNDLPSVELDLQMAIQYLQKEVIHPVLPHKGWFLVKYHGKNLGWIKNLGNRVNNYYPVNYRILSKNILPDA